MTGSTLRIAWRNLGRNRKRTLLCAGAIGLGQLTLVFVNCMMAGMYEEMLKTITGPLVGHVQVHHPEWREERSMELALDGYSSLKRRIEAVPGVGRVYPRVFGAVLVAPGERRKTPADAETGMIVGVDVEGEAGDGGLLEGVAPERMPAGRRVVMGKSLARRLGVERDSAIAVIGQDADEFPVSDLMRVGEIVRASTEVVSMMGVVMSLDAAQGFLGLPDRVHEIVIHGEGEVDAGELAARVKALPELKGAEVLSWREAVPELVGFFDMKDWMDVIFVAIMFVAAAAGIVNTIMMAVFERTREIGTLLAVGARPGRIVWMIFLESVMLGVIGVAAGSVLGTALVLVTGRTGIDYAALAGMDEMELAYKGMNFSYVMYPIFEIRHVVFGFAAVTVTAALASVWPALRASRLEPAEAMRA